MFHNRVRILIVSIFIVNTIVAQSNWVSTCGREAPSLSQIMVDPCGSEITNEYIIFKTSAIQYDIRNLRVKVYNPQNNVLAGSINNYYRASNVLSQAVVAQLNNNYPCAIGSVFVEGAAAPINGIIPPHSTILAFNNVPNVATLTQDVASIAQACGSRVYVVFGDATVSLYYNNQPVSCTNGCIRRIFIDHAGQSDTSNFCSKYTYDASLLPRPPNTGSNPPNGYGSGSYIRPLANGTMGYGGGYLNKNNCFPDSALACTPPTLPDYGNHVWNVLGFKARNNYSSEKFKGYYVARGNHLISTPPGGGTLGSFEFNPVLDGWGVLSSPSYAQTTGGALQSWLGCTIPNDTFSIQAKRQGFPCGYYYIKVQSYDDDLRLRIDQKGDGTGVKEINNPTKGIDIWQGYLGDSTKIDIYASDDSAQFNNHIVFYKNDSGHPPIDIQKGLIQNLKCFNDNSGEIHTTTKGGLTPYFYSWAGTTPIANNIESPTHLAAGIYAVSVLDNTGCKDTLKDIVVTQPLPVFANAGRDIKVCGDFVANSSMGGNPTGFGGSGTLKYSWQPSNNINDATIANPSLIATPSVSGNIIVSVTDDSACVARDSLLVTVFPKNTTHRDTFVCLPLTVDTMIYRHSNVHGCDSVEFVAVKWLKHDTIILPILSRCSRLDTATQIKKLTNAHGCDSIVIQRFVLANADTVRRDSFICNTLTINELKYTFKNRFGCDSVDIVTLKLLKKDTTFLPILSRCSRFDTATQIKKLSNINGCDSIVIQQFVLSNADTVRRDSFVCKALSFNELSYTFKNRFGCDSVEIVSLKLLQKDTTILPILRRCSPTDTVTQITKLTNANGCDSIIIQPFALLNADTIRRDSFVCNTLTINELKYTFKNRFGCDSVEIVSLKLLKNDTTFLPILSRCSIFDTATQIKKLSNINGCDSIVIQQFVLSNADTVWRDSLVCKALSFNELSYTFKNRFGCDSVEIVALKLLQKDTTILPILRRCSPTDTVTQITKLTNANGCDSIIIQRFVLTNADTVRRDSLVCNTLIINELKYTYKNRFGCDSVEIVALKLLKNDTTILPVLSRCSPTDTVTQITKLTNANGCDSIIIQRFGLTNADTVRRDSFVCNTLIINELKYTYKNRFGCDSVEIVALKLLKNDTTILPVLSPCSPTDTVTQITKLTNANGCDSIIIQRFGLTNADTVRRDSFICNTLIINELKYTYKNRFGCDSVEIVALKLLKNDTTILPVLNRCSPTDTVTQITKLTNANGCDSIIIQRFVLANADTVRRDSFICNTLTINELKYTYKNRFGCDSVEIVSLKRLRQDTTILTPLSRCDARDTSSQIRHLTNSVGCDSIVIQPFLLANKDTSIFNLTSCNERDTGTVYTVLVNRFGCENLVIRQTHLVPSGIKTQLSIEKGLICHDDTIAEIALKKLEGGKTPYLIHWSNGATAERLMGLGAGKYQVSITDARGCTLRDSIIIAPPPPLSITTQIQSPRCFEEKNGSWMIEKIEGGVTPYSIQFENNNILNVQLPFSRKNLSANTYHFVVTDSNGCTAKDSVFLKENPKRNVSFKENPVALKWGDSIRLSPEFNFTPRNWKWMPPHLFTCDTCLFPTVKPPSSITYKLIAADESGCETSAYLSVKVQKLRNVFPPNSFSPNGDGYNDRFIIFTGITVERIKILEIYNRWGSKVFENRNFLPNDENAGWDGNFKGQNAESTVYVYYFTVIYKDGSEEVIQGEVSLIR